MPSQLPPNEPTWNWSIPVSSHISRLEADNKQLRFLLGQAPMIDAPTEYERLVASQSKFAYIHPKTIAKYVSKLSKPFLKFGGSPTIYIITSLMPEGFIIYSPNLLPGYENRIATFITRQSASLNAWRPL
jgi:hypothetical protein